MSAARQRRAHLAPAWLALLLVAWAAGQEAAAAAAPPPASSASLKDQLLQRYLSNEELSQWMNDFVRRCSGIARTLRIGQSVLGAELLMLELSEQPGVSDAKPNFKYVGNMHGDEPSGRALLARLAEYVCANHTTDARARRLVRDMHLFIMPTMNPDGFARRTRNNAANVDLNRNFPDPVEVPDPAELLNPLPNAQLETLSMMNLLLGVPFAAAANLHEGAVVANYPYDGYDDRSRTVNGTRHPCPDDAAFVHLAKTYARHHKTMAASKEFKDGIVNGAQWYPVYGGMQDWSYVAAGCLDVTLELSEDKWRPEAHLPALWDENVDALLELPIAAALGGVRGRVTSTSAGTVALEATISVDGIARNSSAAPPFGFYTRPLAPGAYNVTASHPGYEPSTVLVVVPADGSGVEQHFTLRPLPGTLGVGRHRGGRPGQAEGSDYSVQHAMWLGIAGLTLCGVGASAVLQLVQGRSRTRGRAPAYLPASAIERV